MWHWKLESSPTTIRSCTKLRHALKKWVSPKGINKQKQSRAFSGGARKWRELGVFYSQPHTSLWTSDWAMYWRWKMTLLDLSCLQRMAVFALKCLSVDASLGEKPIPAERTLFPGSAVGRTLKLKRDLHRSSGNTLQFLNPLKVSCWKGLWGVSSLHACGSPRDTRPTWLSSKRKQSFLFSQTESQI